MTLFGVGKILLKEYTIGAVMLAVAVAAGAVIYWIFPEGVGVSLWISLILLLPILAFSGPVEFGWQELRAAVASRNPAPQRFPRDAEVLSDAPAECFLLTPDYVSGGDVRGVMYGLLEAARQIRTNGYVEDTTAAAVSSVRSLRYPVRDLDQGREFWKTMFQNLARARINRLLIFCSARKDRGAPYPFLIKLVVFPDVELEGITSIERGRNLDALKHISQLANEYAVDLGDRDLES